MVFHALVGYFSVNLLITNHIHRIEAVAHPLDPFAQCPPQHGDARIRRREDFQGMHGDRPLAYPAPRDHRACADVLRISALTYWAPARATTAINVLVTLAAVMRDRCRCRAYSRSGRRRTAEPARQSARLRRLHRPHRCNGDRDADDQRLWALSPPHAGARSGDNRGVTVRLLGGPGDPGGEPDRRAGR